MQVLTDTYGRILTQFSQDGDFRTAVVWVPGGNRIDWDDASDQELVTLLSKYGYNDALTIENNNVTINDNDETEELTWDSAAMDFTVDVDLFQNGAQNMFFRTVNDGSRDVTVLCDADGKAIITPQLGEYTGVLFTVADNGTKIDIITDDDTYSRGAIIEACGGSFNITALNAGAAVFLLVMGTHIQYCNGVDLTTTPSVTRRKPALMSRNGGNSKNYAVNRLGQLMMVDFAEYIAPFYQDQETGKWNRNTNGDWVEVMQTWGSFEVQGNQDGYAGIAVQIEGTQYVLNLINSTVTPELESYD